jgi:5-methylcytosine-specific restriction endonuclease McrA
MFLNTLLLEVIKTFPENIKVPCRILYCDSVSELKEYFCIVNDRLPLSDIIYDESGNQKEIIEKTLDYFDSSKYKYFFRNKKKRLNRPFIDKNEFMNELFKSQIIEKKNIKNYMELVRYIINLNNTYIKKYLSNSDKKLKNILIKIRKNNDFYLGVEKNWIDDLMVLQDFEPSSISKTLRNVLWSINMGKRIEGKCLCCSQRTIYKDNFHGGHIISVKNGGRTNRENIIPICQHCNLDMGTKNLFTYMKKKEFNTEYANHLEILYLKNKDIFQL